MKTVCDKFIIYIAERVSRVKKTSYHIYIRIYFIRYWSYVCIISLRTQYNAYTLHQFVSCVFVCVYVRSYTIKDQNYSFYFIWMEIKQAHSIRPHIYSAATLENSARFESWSAPHFTSRFMEIEWCLTCISLPNRQFEMFVFWSSISDKLVEHRSIVCRWFSNQPTIFSMKISNKLYHQLSCSVAMVWWSVMSIHMP